MVPGFGKKDGQRSGSTANVGDRQRLISQDSLQELPPCLAGRWIAQSVVGLLVERRSLVVPEGSCVIAHGLIMSAGDDRHHLLARPGHRSDPGTRLPAQIDAR